MVQLPRIREIFWAGSSFSLAGDTMFTGTFHLFKGGREVARQPGAMAATQLMRWVADSL